MKIVGNTILITGGTSGIGFELATRFLALGNTVIVTGQSRSHLDDAARNLPGVHALQSDVSDPAAIADLCRSTVKEFPGLNMLINNAGIMRKINLQAFGADLHDLTREIEVNLNGAIRMAVQFLPQLKNQHRAAIVAIHSFTQSLRIQLQNTSVAVFELAPPITDTALFRSDLSVDDVGVKPMDVGVLGQHAIDGIASDRLEIRPGLSNMLKLMSRVAPDFIAGRLGKSTGHILAQAG
jgi:uncharacterized oxidoreductase